MKKDSFKVLMKLMDEASHNKTHILKHPLVSTMHKFFFWTPLHLLADHGVKEVLLHPDVTIVKSIEKDTPFDTICKHYHMVKKDISLLKKLINKRNKNLALLNIKSKTKLIKYMCGIILNEK